jgi:hypothetical protein
MANLITLANPQLPITLQYPDPTPLGYKVNVIEKTGDISYRIHLVSEGPSEIYFEVGKYLNLSISEAVNLFKNELIENISNVEISAVTTTIIASKPAYHLTVRWPSKERRVFFIEHEEKIYRIILDPLSDINEQILKTFAFKVFQKE